MKHESACSSVPKRLPAMPRAWRAFCLASLLVLVPAVAAAQGSYFPSAEEWERRSPAEVGMDPVQLAEALAGITEWAQPRDLLEMHAASFGREPMGEAIGPFTIRGPATGVVIRRGYIVAEWGEPTKVDPTYSVTKSFLSSTVGLAYDRGLIPDIDEPVKQRFAPVLALNAPPEGAAISLPAGALSAPSETNQVAAECSPIYGQVVGADRITIVPAGPCPSARRPAEGGARNAFDAFELIEPFESPLNAKITWNHLLRQTSDWEGTLWGKPDWVDRPPRDVEAHRTRVHNEPGTSWTYNDVRVNLLALAALNVWRRPLPEVLKEHLMDPIGASGTWRWFGYDNSWVVMDGRLVQSVSGGAHWGGGMWINAYDMARFGLLTLHRGRWGERQILSDEWVAMALTPTDVQRTYGFMNWYVRPGESAFRHSGTGNTIYVYPEEELVVVTRWVGNAGTVASRVLASVED